MLEQFPTIRIEQRKKNTGKKLKKNRKTRSKKEKTKEIDRERKGGRGREN